MQQKGMFTDELWIGDNFLSFWAEIGTVIDPNSQDAREASVEATGNDLLLKSDFEGNVYKIPSREKSVKASVGDRVSFIVIGGERGAHRPLVSINQTTGKKVVNVNKGDLAAAMGFPRRFTISTVALISVPLIRFSLVPHHAGSLYDWVLTVIFTIGAAVGGYWLQNREQFEVRKVIDSALERNIAKAVMLGREKVKSEASRQSSSEAVSS